MKETPETGHPVRLGGTPQPAGAHPMKETTKIAWSAAVSTAVVIWLLAVFVLSGLPAATAFILWAICFPMVFAASVKNRAAERELERK